MDDGEVREDVPVSKLRKSRRSFIGEVKALLKDRASWQMVKVDSHRPQKVHTGEAYDRFRGFDLTHDELVELTADAKYYSHQINLLASHNSWDVDWVVEQLSCYEDFELGTYTGVAIWILHSTTNPEVTVRAAEMMSGWKRGGRLHTHCLGNGSHLDDDSLFKLADLGFSSVLEDDRFSEEDILKFWDKFLNTGEDVSSNYYDGLLSFFYWAILGNYNTPSWLLDEAVRKSWMFSSKVYGNPNLSAETLNVLLGKTVWKEHKVLIAKHHNASMGTLKKLSKSAYQPLAETALVRLEEKDAERQRKKRRNF